MMQVRSRSREDPSPPPQWVDLPHELTANILRRLGAVEILLTAQIVCKTWQNVCKDPDIWRVVDLLNVGDMLGTYEIEMISRHAVDRSQGLLVAISVALFVSDDLLLYIAERSGKLRSLVLETFKYLSCDGLIEAIKRLPQLEELELNMIYVADFHRCIEIVGRSCPFLKSFGFNIDDCESHGFDNDTNEVAFAIARSMPELRCLELYGNGLSNEGLEAILDGCPHLESLDLRNCYHVKLEGDLGKRLSAQLKCLKVPNSRL